MKKLSEIKTGKIAAVETITNVGEVSVGVQGRPFVPHADDCGWKRGPVVRLGKDGVPVATCPECGAATPLPRNHERG